MRLSPAARLRNWLERPGVVWLAVLLGIGLTLPSLTGGLYFDDHVLKVAVKGHPSFPDAQVSPFDLFRFMTPERQAHLEILDRWVGLWGVHEDIQIAFMRPLSSLTHASDFWMWPNEPWIQHMQSVLWYAALVLLVSRYYRRVLGASWVAGLAGLLYAIDDAHGITVGWIANRNGLIAGVFGVACLWVHDCWRRDGWRPGAWLGPFLFAVALLGGESAIAVCAYLVSHALFLERGPWRDRLFALMPFALVVVSWRVLYTALGYGVVGTDLYVDPIREPLVFLQVLGERLPVLLLGQLGLPPSEVWIVTTDKGRTFLTLSAAGAVVAITLLVLPVLRQSAEMRFFGMGALLAAVPISASYPFDRLLTFVGLGAMGLVAGFFAYVFRTQSPSVGRASKVATLGLAGAWLGIHVVLAPVLLPVRALLPSRLDEVMGRVSDTLPTDDALGEQTLILVNTPDITFSYPLVFRRASVEEPLPAYVRFLSVSEREIAVHRVDERALTLRCEDGFFARPMDRILRGRRYRFTPGDTFELTGFQAQVLETTADGRPSNVRFQFQVPLEDGSLRWASWDGQGFAPFVPPGVGKTVTLPASGVEELF